jgi:hypothetical protein
MFVRWRRRSSGRLSARLVHNQRVGDRVRQHHVAKLGAISPAHLEPANTVEGIVARGASYKGRIGAAGLPFCSQILPPVVLPVIEGVMKKAARLWISSHGSF